MVTLTVAPIPPSCRFARALLYTFAAAAVGGDLAPVQERRIELRPQAAHGDRLTLAAVAVDGHTRNALQRFGHILVGELTEVFGGYGIHDADGAALDIPGPGQASADTGDDDLFQHAILFQRVSLGHGVTGAADGEDAGDRGHQAGFLKVTCCVLRAHYYPYLFRVKVKCKFRNCANVAVLLAESARLINRSHTMHPARRPWEWTIF